MTRKDSKHFNGNCSNEFYRVFSTMRIIVLVLATILFIPQSEKAQSFTNWIFIADSCYNAQDFAQSSSAYQQAFKLYDRNPLYLYNGGCSAALAGDKTEAFKCLELAYKRGWNNVEHIRSDGDLISLHNEKEWSILLEKMQKRKDKIEKHVDHSLQTELLDILEKDQDIRNAYMEAASGFGYDHPKVDSLGKVMHLSDSINLGKVSHILETRGWVGPKVVGQQANGALFLVVQHADIKTQEKYLPMMRSAAKKGNASYADLALLEDRVALRLGKKQIYGSQIMRDKNTNRFMIMPLEDPDHVDKRRFKVGLGPIADYAANWNIAWDVEEYKKQLPEIEKLHREQQH